MNHGRREKAQVVTSRDQLCAITDGVQTVPQAIPKELRGHLRALGGEHHLCAGIAPADLGQGGGVVGLHVVDHDVVKLPAVQRGGQVVEEHAGDGLVHRVHEHGFFIQQKVAVVADPAGDGKDVFKQVQPAVVAAHPQQIRGDPCGALHEKASLKRLHMGRFRPGKRALAKRACLLYHEMRVFEANFTILLTRVACRAMMQP